MAIVAIILTIIYPVDELVYFIPIIIITILIINFLNDKQTKKELRDSILNLEHSRDDLIQQMEINYNNSQMVHEIGQAINKYININEILDNVIQVLEKDLDMTDALSFFQTKTQPGLFSRRVTGIQKNKWPLSNQRNLT